MLTESGETMMDMVMMVMDMDDGMTSLELRLSLPKPAIYQGRIQEFFGGGAGGNTIHNHVVDQRRSLVYLFITMTMYLVLGYIFGLNFFFFFGGGGGGGIQFFILARNRAYYLPGFHSSPSLSIYIKISIVKQYKSNIYSIGA